MLDDGCRMLKLGVILRERLQRKSRSENGASEASVSFHEELQRKARYFFARKKQGKKIHAQKNVTLA
jgi:hypothetical protein